MQFLTRITPLIVAPVAWAAPQSPYSDLEPAPARAFERADAALAAIVELPEVERTYANTVEAVDDAVARLFADVGFRSFMEHVSPVPSVRERGAKVGLALSSWFSDLTLREDLYAAVSGWAAAHEAPAGARGRLLEELIRDFRRSGMELDAETRERVREIDRELAELGREFALNIASDDSVALLTGGELAGLSAEELELYERSGELYVVPMRAPSIRAIMQGCEVPATRQKVSLQYSRRGGSRNARVIEQLVALRHERANLLGYPTTAHYELEVKMAGTPERVTEFYADLLPRVAAKAELDVALYEQAERAHTGDPAATFQPWDRSFYNAWLLRERYNVDPREVQQYFPLEAVYGGLFELTAELFGIRYAEVAATDPRARTQWHPDVQLFDVFDASTDGLLGSFYIDLFPREGKYTHAAQFPIRLRKVFANGEVLTPVVALVCNFTKPTADKPSLLTHSEVETFFHEFGHCLHSILSESELSWFAGTNVARDFVEAPSQMLENWVWDAGVLGRFARHYETGEPLPAATLEGLVAASKLGSGYSNQRQVYLGLLDMHLHSDPDGRVDVDAVARAAHAEVSDLPWTEGSLGYASFGHLDGYQAGYYGYLWSLVYAQDMFTPFEAQGLLDAELGRRYRATVLGPGGTRDALELVTEFLGREPDGEAFARHLGL